MKKLLSWFAEEMNRRGFKTWRCKNKRCRAVHWIESDSTLEEIIEGTGGVTLMRYAHIPESECGFCEHIRKASKRFEP